MINKDKFTSVSDMLEATLEDQQCIDEIEALALARSITRSLMAIRAAKGLSQKDIAKDLDCSQSRISKLESGVDTDLSLGDLAGYANAVGYEVNLALIDSEQPSVDRIKYHAIAISRLLEELVELAHTDESIAKGVSGFFGEAFFNLLNILKQSSEAMPTKPDGTPMVKIDVIGPIKIPEDQDSQGRSIASNKQCPPEQAAV